MSTFSQELIQKMQTHFADKYGKLLTSEEAEAYLNSWADLFLTVGG